MFNQQYVLQNLDETERQRLHEILFYHLVTRMLKRYEPFTMVVDFIFACGTFFGCNTTVLHKVLLRILNNNMLYKPHQMEAIVLMQKAKIPVRSITELLDISNFTVYKYIKEYITNPCAIDTKHNQLEYYEIKNFLTKFNELKGII